MAFSIPNLPYFLAKCVLAMQRQRHETVCRLLCTASLSIRDSMSRTAEPFIRLEIEDGWERLLSVERHLSEGSVIPQHTQKPPLFPHARREAMLRVPRVRQRNTPMHVEWVGGHEVCAPQTDGRASPSVLWRIACHRTVRKKPPTADEAPHHVIRMCTRTKTL
jgi:hypothetical protein